MLLDGCQYGMVISVATYMLMLAPTEAIIFVYPSILLAQGRHRGLNFSIFYSNTITLRLI